MKKSSKKSSKKIKTVRTTLTVLIQGTQQFALDIPTDEDGNVNETIFAEKEEEILNEIQRIFPALSVETVDVE